MRLDVHERNILFGRVGEMRAEVARLEAQLGLAERPLAHAPLPEDQASAYALVAEHASDMLSVHSATGDYLFVSPACESLFGWKREQLVGANAYAFFHPDDILRVAADHEKHVDATPGKIRYRLRCASGGFRWVETRSRAHHGPDGLEQIICITRDVEGEVQSERLRLLRGLTGSFAHELNNPLAAAHLALGELPRELEGVGDLAVALHRITTFVRDIQSLAHADGSVGSFDVVAQLRAAAADLEHPERLRIEGDPAPVRADEVLLRHLVRSLVHAFAEGGAAQVRRSGERVEIEVTGVATRGRAHADLAAVVRGGAPRLAAALELAERTATEMGAIWHAQALPEERIRVVFSLPAGAAVGEGET